jgi:LuxR family maltose regulon positive regulatory protein
MSTDTNLLQTKFFYPKVLERAIHRWRLTAVIENGLSRRITLISAPAGFGKTSLLADWIQEYNHQPVWLSLDESDNDPIRFMDYFIQALLKFPSTRLNKLISEKLKTLKNNPQQQMDILLNCLLDSGEKVTIVLDDYQHIHSPAIPAFLNYFIENLSANVHIIFATRSDPPLDLANWRAKGYLNEIRQADLCFTDAEASAFFTHNIPFDFTLEECKILNKKIEGWIAGMQLAATAISKQKDKRSVERFIHSFKGTNRYILDYLMEEVLKNQPADVKAFLLNTSLLDRFCAPLCDHVLHRNNSRELMNFLVQNNLFIIPLDNQCEWYRYHRLFADLLKSQNDVMDQGEIISFHLSASEWFEENGHYAEAIDQLFLAGDVQNAAKLIQTQAKNVLNHSEFFTFANWIKRLPEDFLFSSPTLCSYYAISMILEGKPYHEIEKILKVMEQMDYSDNFNQTIVQVLIAIIQGNYAEAAEDIQAIKNNPPREDEFLIGLLDIAQSMVYEGDLETALSQLENTYKKARTNGNLTIAITSLTFMGDLYKYQGKLNKAWRLYQDALDLAFIGEDEFLPASSSAFIGLGEILYKWNRLSEAESMLNKSLDLSGQWEIMHFFSGLTSLARVQIAQNKFEEAMASMQKAEALAEQFDTSELDDFVVACRVTQLKLLMGNVDQNQELEKKIEYPIPQANWKNNSYLLFFALVQEIQELTHAWILLQRDNYSQAIPVLEDLYNRAEQIQLDDYAIQYAVLLSIAYHKNKNQMKARQYIAIALGKAKPENQIRVFLEQGAEIIDLLYDAIQQNIEAEFAGKIIALFPQMEIESEKNKLIEVNGEIIEALTAREVEIIRLIAQGLSNQEIAYSLHLSLSTIKVHIYNIYRKLNVHNRTQAVAKAKPLNIIP